MDVLQAEHVCACRIANRSQSFTALQVETPFQASGMRGGGIAEALVSSKPSALWVALLCYLGKSTA